MEYNRVKEIVLSLCEDNSLDFNGRGKTIANITDQCSINELLEHLEHAGVIPECFAHDSTEEKVYAKYCDSLLTRVLSELGLKARTISERSDAADVEAEGHKYKIVGDAKAFRLSRTAKNQKDFKVESLSIWKRDADFACLVAPIYQYPTRTSQIYHQATRLNVTLLSYTHLSFMIRSAPNIIKRNRLREIWQVPNSLKPTKNATTYWKAIDNKMIDLSGVNSIVWQTTVKEALNILPKIGKEEISYWEEEKKRISELSHKEAVEELIKARKIDTKIEIIKRTARIS